MSCCPNDFKQRADCCAGAEPFRWPNNEPSAIISTQHQSGAVHSRAGGGDYGACARYCGACARYCRPNTWNGDAKPGQHTGNDAKFTDARDHTNESNAGSNSDKSDAGNESKRTHSAGHSDTANNA